MESEFKFFVPPPFAPFSTSSPGGFDVFNNDYELNNLQITDLEAHFSSHFNLEIDNGINRNNYESNIRKDIVYEKNYDNLDETSWDLDNFNNEETIEDYNYVTDLKSCLYDEVNDLDNDDNVNSLPETNEDFDFININIGNVDCAEEISKKSERYETKDELIIQELTSLSDAYVSDDFLNNMQNVETKESLPPMEMAFSKHSCNYKQKDSMQRNDLNAVIGHTLYSDSSQLSFNNLDNYSYPNNILNNFTFEKYVNEKVATENGESDCKTYEYRDGCERKLSVCESLESDAQTVTDVLEDISDSVLYGDNDFLIDLEELGLNMEEEDNLFEVKSNSEQEDLKSRSRFGRKPDRDQTTGERVCCWHNCSERYPNQSTLVEHIEKVHVNSYKGEEFSCLWSECSRGRRPFNARYKLLIHMRVHSGHKPNRCNHPGCGKSFSRLENLKIHRRSHTGERPYRCQAPLCRKAFSNSSDRAKHQRTHFNARPYACQVDGCSKRYTDPSSLRKHVKNHSPGCAPPHRTSHCDTPPSQAIFDCALADKRRHQAQALSHTSPVKLNTLKSIRNKLSEQSGRRIANVWPREGVSSPWIGSG